MSKGRLRADPTGRHVALSSSLITDLVAEQYAAALKQYAKGKMLDLGCGQAPLYGIYGSLVDQIVCIDWPASLHQQQHVDVFSDLTKSLPLRDGSFDTVLLSDVLEHIPNPDDIIHEIARVLAPGGHVIIGVPFLYWLHEVPHDFNRYTKYQLERFFKIAKLDPIEITEVGGLPEVLTDLIGKALRSKRRAAGLFHAAARFALRSPVVQRYSRRSASTFPIAYLAVATKRLAEEFP